eukprot:SAG22_NODE_3_length_48349_cov_158.681180_28_plen_138_part_00
MFVGTEDSIFDEADLGAPLPVDSPVSLAPAAVPVPANRPAALPPGVAPLQAEKMLCSAKQGVLAMQADEGIGICCPAACAEYCNKQGGGCSAGPGGGRACCHGKVVKDGPACHVVVGALQESGCKMLAATSWLGGSP